MNERVELISGDGSTQFVDCAIAKGNWWEDGWVTPPLEVEVGLVREINRLKLSGYNSSDSAKWLGNHLTLVIGDQSGVWPLGWGKSFELSMNLAPSLSGPTILAFNVRHIRAGDALDSRTLGIILRKITLYEAT